MKIVKDYPPNYETLKKHFDIGKMRGLVFAWGDILYNPDGGGVEQHLMVHEETHGRQQAEIGIQTWWDRYITDPRFRLEQEVEAYRAQYKFAQENMARSDRRRLLQFIAKALSGPIYGHLVSKDEAVELITK